MKGMIPAYAGWNVNGAMPAIRSVNNGDAPSPRIGRGGAARRRRGCGPSSLGGEGVGVAPSLQTGRSGAKRIRDVARRG